MNSPANARPPGRSRLALIAASFLALLGSFVVTPPAQAGYYGGSYYGYNPCSYRPRCGGYGYGYPRYGYAPYRHYGCSGCGGCYRRCGSVYRSGAVYERRYIEREYVERRYGYGGYGRNYGYYPYGGYGRNYGYNPYGGYRSSGPFPWGYGGVRGVPTPYGYGYQPSAYGYEGPPRPPAPVWGGAGYEAAPYGNESDY
jgi:hypothetical protein